jgi:RND superfamily putative drug exporter
MDLSSYILNLVVGVGLGISIDYSLLMYYRYREERLAASDAGSLDNSPEAREAAVVRTMLTAGRAVVFSGTAVAIGLATLLLMPLPFMQGFGVAGLVIPIVSIVAALTLMPVLLYSTSHWLERARILPRRTLLGRDDIEHSMWMRLARTIMRRPGVFFAVSALALLGLATPVTGLVVTPGSDEGIPRSVESIKGVNIMDAAIGDGAGAPTTVVVDSGRPGGAHDEHVQAAAARLVDEARADGEVALVSDPAAPTSYDSTGRYVRVDITGSHEYGDLATRKLVRRVRTHMVDFADFPRSAHVLVGGQAAIGVDLIDTAYGTFPWLVALVLVLTYFLLLRAFRSLLLPLKAIVLNLLSIGASYGLLVLVFGSSIAGAVGLTGFAPVEFWIPVFMFAMLFGVSMDYEVFLVSRMREEWDAGATNEQAVAVGLARTGRLVTAAGLIMVAAFAGFMASSPVGFQQFGLGLSSAILIDVTLVRCLLLPSAMKLFGRWNWWLPANVARIMRVEPSPLAPRESVGTGGRDDELARPGTEQPARLPDAAARQAGSTVR